MEISHLDHLVLRVKSTNNAVDFYTRILGMKCITFGEGRIALLFGDQKINLHEQGNEFEPKALNVKDGSADLCFIVKTSIIEAKKHIEEQGLMIIDGPVQRTGALGKIISIYFRDPDGNLIELSNYL